MENLIRALEAMRPIIRILGAFAFWFIIELKV